MQLHDLYPAPGSRKNRKRVGRGNSGKGGTTAGRGQKGQLSRSGGGKGPGFEGGQMKMTMRLPKRGFTNNFRTEYAAINVDRLEIFEDGQEVTPVTLIEAGIIKNVQDGIKIMGGGELTKKLTVRASKFTATAKEKIEAAGGKAEVL